MKEQYIKQFFIILIIIITFSLQAQENYTLQNIKFIGNKTFSRKTLLEEISLRGTNIFKKYLLRKKPFKYSEEILKVDLSNLERFYQTEGFLYAKVEKHNLEVEHKDEKINLLTIKITEGPSIDIGNIEYVLDRKENKNYEKVNSILSQIKNSISLSTGKRFRDEIIEQAKNFVRDHFFQAGYAFVEIEHHLDIIEEENKVNITWKIKPGPRCVFGETKVKGNKYISSSFIRDQLTYTQGEIFSEDKIQKVQENIYNLGLFQLATIQPKYEKREGNKIPIIINLKESPRLNIQYGVGYGTEDKFRASVNLNRRNILGGARRLEMMAKHSDLEPYNLNLKWIQPQFITRRTTIVMNPYLRLESEPGYETRRIGFNLPVTHYFTSDNRVSFNFYMEKVKQASDKDDPEFAERSSENYLYDKSGIILSQEFKNSQPNFFPDQGMYANISYKINGYIFPGDFNYNRLMLDLRKYQDIYDLVLASRIKIGVANSSDRDDFIPVEDRFYSGGSRSVRGWSRSQLGPSIEGDPIGGKSLLEGSMELRYPIYKILSGVVFTDIGNVWLDSYNYELNKLRYNVGLGLRVRTPIGPVRVDLARPVEDKKETLQLHINIGQAF